MLHPLKCATAKVTKIVLQTLLYFIKRYGTFLQGIVIIIIFLENLFMVAKSTNHYKFTHAIIKNRCIIFTFNIFIYCVILVFELFFFFTSHLSTLYFFPFNYRLFFAIISNVIKKIKIKNTTTMYLFFFL